MPSIIDLYDNMNRDLLGYEVYRSTASGSGYVNIGSTNASTTSYTDNAVTNGTTYYYVVTAIFDEGESPYSNEASATPEVFESPIPEELTGEAGDAQATLSWTATDPGGGGGGTSDMFIVCGDGSAEYEDCVGLCFNNSDCASGGYDGCVEGQTTWLGDGYASIISTTCTI
jgi:hypothetical protein